MIGTLIKINVKALFSSAFRRSKQRKKINPGLMILIGLLVVYVLGAFFMMFGLMFHNICKPFFAAGIGWFYFSLAGLIIFALCFIGSFFMVQTQLFNARDNELLLSMPIKPSTILIGRLAALLIYEYLFELFVFIPAFAVLIISGAIAQIPVTGIILFVLAGVLLPLPALALGCLFGWIVALITSRMRKKNIVTFVMTLAFLIVYFWLYSKATTYMNLLVERGAEIAEAVRRALFPAYHLGIASAEGSLLSFIIFAICAAAPFIIMFALLSHSFIRVATANRGAKKLVYREKALRASSVGRALVVKELRRFISNPMYILNAGLGGIALLALAGVLIVKPDVILNTLAPLGTIMPGVTPGIIAVAVLTGLAGFTFISAPTISLEGGKLWIIKTVPAPVRVVLLSKLAPHMIAGGGAGIIAGLVCIFRLPGESALVTVLILITPLSLTLLTGLAGLALNLIFPRFDWINEIQPIKQGMSVMITMFGAMAVIIALVLVYILGLRTVLSLDSYLLLCTALFLILSGALYAYLMSAGVSRFEALDG